ncbi:acyl-CoA dehydrogenase family protein [Brevundimonas vesicularis]|uniref:acyl-CoA dehydrogenase family protein n=1 Tax=Brevundimonas vesicularis TaxID=41276 RepID=UPI0038D37EED
MTDTGRKDGWWVRLAQEIGVLGIAQDEAVGGLGGDLPDLALVAEIFGEHLVNEPLIPCIALAGDLLHDGGEGATALLSAMVAAEALVAPALFERNSRYHAGAIQTVAEPVAEGWRLSGRKAVVRAAPWASHLVVSARSGEGLSLFAVPADAPGISQIAYPTYDGQRAAEVLLDDVIVGMESLIGPAHQALPRIERALDQASLIQASEAIGLMRHMVAATREHLTTRQQFGQPLSRFQVLQHRMADMTMALARAEAVTGAALKQVTAGGQDQARRVSGVKLAVDASAALVAEGAVQLHGAIGMTEELSVSHAFKRLTLIQTEFGDTAFHRARIGQRLAA